MHQGPLGQLSIGGKGGSAKGVRSTKSMGDSAGEGKTGTTSVLAAKSTGKVGISDVGGKGASAEDNDVGRARRSSSEYCSSAFFIIHMMSWNCRSKLGVILAWSLG